LGKTIDRQKEKMWRSSDKISFGGLEGRAKRKEYELKRK